MNDSELNQLRETAWQRKLTPGEEARLQAHLALQPDTQGEWDEELALTTALRAMPRAPVASNFTARVMQAVAHEQRASERSRSAKTPWWQRLSPRLAWAALLLLCGSTTLLYHRNSTQTEFAQNVAEVSTLAALPDPAILRDFEAINELRQAQAAAASDDALIAVIEHLR